MPSYVKYCIIILLAGILFLPFLGNVHLFDWDEINFAECAREMLTTGDYLRPQIDYQPFWEKPPLFIWMQALAMKMFGVGEYAARFPNAFMGIVTLVTIFYIGKRVLNEKMATWWTLLYAACWLPHLYFKSGIIDPTFNFFIFTAFFQVYLLRSARRKLLHALLAGLFLGLAVMTKGPVAILVALLCFITYIVVNKGLWGYKLQYLFVVAMAAAITFFSWIAAAIIVHGWNYGVWFLNEFITYQVKLFTTEDAGHGGPFFYHFIVLLFGCFPASIFLLQYNRKRITASESSRDFTRWMWILFSVVLILFSIVKTKIVHYSSLCYFPLTYLAALQIYRLSEGEARLKKFTRVSLLVSGGLIAMALVLLPIAGVNIKGIAGNVDDKLTAAYMQADVSWHWAESAWGISYLAAVIYSYWQLKVNFKRGMIALCVQQIIIAQIVLLHFIPKIEAYSQRPAIEFFKSFEGQDVYVYSLGYHSYAQFFYTKKPPSASIGKRDKYSLVEGTTDKPTYFISRVNRVDEYKKYPQLREIGRKSSFVFFKKDH